MTARIKFCGMTRADDVRAAADAGADAVGFVLAAGSARCVALTQLPELLAAVPAFVTPVVLFRDNPEADIHQALAMSPRFIAQFHGDESPAQCAAFGRDWLKAVPMGALADNELPVFLDRFAQAGCRGFVFDAHGGTVTGGSGRRFDWSRIPATVPGPVILAGGLSADTVAEAVRAVRPYAVDVSSGVESAPGIKDHAKLRRFADEVFRVRTV